ncbi:hypothetical protein EHQ47_05640 [Leptospira bourretii]|uniref:hypothetical protein n=1 Tax=Leptospira bourretii TaxID=2484962 RepID=UPI0010917998|nr:hypothetical protein [Leptospira bourretii]TGL23359.1 hypothetical protein EHQ47_05640 [Leptospira bourretii]
MNIQKSPPSNPLSLTRGTKNIIELFGRSKSITNLMINFWQHKTKIRILKFWIKFCYFAFFFGAILLISNQKALPVISWMNVYGVEEYKDLDFPSYLKFLKELMIPIPINLTILEYLSVKVFGDTRIVTEWIYQASFVTLFSIPILFRRKNILKLIISFIFSATFFYASLRIHKGNPQSYDIIFPLLLCITILICKNLETQKEISHLKLLLLGFLLSMLDMLRPFGILIALLICLFVVYILKQKKYKISSYVIPFLPLVFITLPFHYHLYTHHKQLTMTNHSGFNIQRAWPQVMPKRNLVEVDAKPTREGRWPNINTAEHRDNSNYLLSCIIHHIKKHPQDSIKHIIKNIYNFITFKYTLLNYQPEGFIKYCFYTLRFLCFIYLFSQLLKLIKNRSKPLIINTEFLVLFLILFQLFIFSLTESGETIRFTIGLLPLLSIFPRFKYKK